MEQRCTERGEASVKKRILLGLISVFKALYNAVYAVMKLRPMQKKVVMISRQSNSQILNSSAQRLKRVIQGCVLCISAAKWAIRR